ncbi:MAG: ATP-binding protein [Clostridium sp.]
MEKSLRKKFHKNIFSKFAKAINQYELVKEGDRIAVCISGGKDSMLMAKLFQELKKHNKFPFEVKFLVMDPATVRRIARSSRRMPGSSKFRFRFSSPTFSMRYTLSRNSRATSAPACAADIFTLSRSSWAVTRIALGHHYDDVIETILMGMLYGAQVQTMMPKLHSTNFEGMELIRPLYLVREDDIKAWRDYNTCILSSVPASSPTPAPPAIMRKTSPNAWKSRS